MVHKCYVFLRFGNRVGGVGELCARGVVSSVILELDVWNGYVVGYFVYGWFGSICGFIGIGVCYFSVGCVGILFFWSVSSDNRVEWRVVFFVVLFLVGVMVIGMVWSNYVWGGFMILDLKLFVMIGVMILYGVYFVA